MGMMREKTLKNILKEYKLSIDIFLKDYIKQLQGIPTTLRNAMDYSLMAGGKRIRPILCLSCFELFSEPRDNIMSFACALELIHTYSLIHDDLPAMDNDDYRRGMLTSHKVFGEAIAILTGDGLLTEGFNLMLDSKVKPELLIRAIKEMSSALGPAGMVGGQVLDMELTGKEECDVEQLQHMHILKTGRFIESACVSGAILGGAEGEDIDKIRLYGKMIGLAFQIADDILDIEGDEKKMGKPVGSDEQKGKYTYPKIFGIEKSRAIGWEAVNRAISAIENYDTPHAYFLRALAKYIMTRTE